MERYRHPNHQDRIERRQGAAGGNGSQCPAKGENGKETQRQGQCHGERLILTLTARLREIERQKFSRQPTMPLSPKHPIKTPTTTAAVAAHSPTRTPIPITTPTPTPRPTTLPAHFSAFPLSLDYPHRNYSHPLPRTSLSNFRCSSCQRPHHQFTNTQGSSSRRQPQVFHPQHTILSYSERICLAHSPRAHAPSASSTQRAFPGSSSLSTNPSTSTHPHLPHSDTDGALMISSSPPYSHHRRLTPPYGPSDRPDDACLESGFSSHPHSNPFQHRYSSRASFANPITPSEDPDMAGPGLYSGTLRSNTSNLPPFLPSMNPIGSKLSSSPTPPTRVLIRGLPPNATEDEVRLIFTYSNDLVSVDVLDPEITDEKGFRTAIVAFKTMEAAIGAKKMFDGRLNSTKDANLHVEILSPSPSRASNYTSNPSPTSPDANTSPTALSNSANSNQSSGSRPIMDPYQSRRAQHDGSFSTQSKGFHPFGNGNGNGHNAFPGPTSPVGNSGYSYAQQPIDRARVSGKHFIENSLNDDDETSKIMENPLAYAENGTAFVPVNGRRATAPQIPTSLMENLSIHGSTPPAPASMPSPYGNQLGGYGNGPTTMGNGYASSPHTHQRLGFPPINPADQNPPCNTLYVGNLPVDTNEEELKGLFQKQRGYKRLCFRTKHNGPMCFVEFEDVSFATKALNDLYGHALANSTKGGIRLSFSKNPLGVRSQHNANSSHPGAMGGYNSASSGASNGFTTANGPPPGLSHPAYGQGRGNHAQTHSAQSYNQNGFAGNQNYSYPWQQTQRSNHNGYNASNGSNGFPRDRYIGPNGFDGPASHETNGAYPAEAFNGHGADDDAFLYGYRTGHRGNGTPRGPHGFGNGRNPPGFRD